MISEPSRKKATHKSAGEASQPQANPKLVGQSHPVVPFYARLPEALRLTYARLRRRPGPIGAVWHPAFALLIAAGAIAIALVAVADAMAIDFARTSTAPWLRWMATITDIGKSQWYLIPAGLVFIGIGLADWHSLQATGRRRLLLVYGQAGFAFAAVALSGILVNIIKIIVGRARPVLFDAGGPYQFSPFTAGYNFASFPSGHSTTVGALAGILMLWYPRWTLPILAVGLVLSATRIAADAHYPSDVVAGFLFGLLVAILLARFLATRGVVFRADAKNILPAVIGLAPRK